MVAEKSRVSASWRMSTLALSSAIPAKIRPRRGGLGGATPQPRATGCARAEFTSAKRAGGSGGATPQPRATDCARAEFTFAKRAGGSGGRGAASPRSMRTTRQSAGLCEMDARLLERPAGLQRQGELVMGLGIIGRQAHCFAEALDGPLR